ncbi:Probable carboxylesterase Os04g0669500 [Durusdinium trenchii]
MGIIACRGGSVSQSSSDAEDCRESLRAIAHDLGFKKAPLTMPKGCFTEFVRPSSAAEPRCGLVWMHGLGDTEKGGDFSTSWFDIADLPVSQKTHSFAHHGCSLEEALSSCGRVHAAIDQLITEGIPAERIMVGGFSQGGAMAMLSAVTYPKRLGGIIVFSGICFFGDLLKQLTSAQSAHCTDLAVFWGHGTRDRVLYADLQDEGVEMLQVAGLRVTAKKYLAEHDCTEEELKDAVAFYAANLK